MKLILAVVGLSGGEITLLLIILLAAMTMRQTFKKKD
jgi:hypothetical protein